ncbi:MAG TPA: vWA domain-containing protein, partial [Vicinamibacteria bacterium]|nr:vWA domain-containing protein [Vicinamibacteria bacterium]
MRYRAWLAGAAPLALAAFAGASIAAAADPPPTLVALALDTSGSVGRLQLAQARDLAVGILEALPPGSEVAVLTFDDQSRVVVPRTSQPAEVLERLSTLQVAGRHTALHDALYDASRYLSEAPGLRKAIVLMTDGVDENSALNLEDGLKLAQESGIPVFTVAVGARPRERVLRRIAKLTGGDYLRVDRIDAQALAARIAALPAVAPVTAPAARSTADPAAGAGPPAAAPVTAPRLTASVRTRAVWAAVVLTLIAAAALIV